MSLLEEICQEYVEWSCKHKKTGRGGRAGARSLFKFIIQSQRAPPTPPRPPPRLPHLLAYLAHALTTTPLRSSRKFHLLLSSSISLLKAWPELPFPLSNALLASLERRGRSSPQLEAEICRSIIWVVCRGRRGSRGWAQRVCESGVVLAWGRAEGMAGGVQRVVVGLLGCMVGLGVRRAEVVGFLREHLGKLRHPDCIAQLMQLLRSVGAVEWGQEQRGDLVNFVEEYMQSKEIGWAQKVKHWRVVGWVGSQIGGSSQRLCLRELVRWRLSEWECQQQGGETELVSLVERIEREGDSLHQYLQLACSSLPHNPYARRLFITHHRHLSPASLFLLLAGPLPHTLSLQIADPRLLQNVLKLTICLLMAARGLGMEELYRYSLRGVREKGREVCESEAVGEGRQLVEMLVELESARPSPF